jgi:hypothetical protein
MPTHCMDSRQHPKQVDIIIGLLRVCMALKTLQYCGNTSLLEQRGALRAIHTLNNPKNYTGLLGGMSAIHLVCQHGVQGLMWGARGPFLPAAAMVVAVVTPVVFMLRLLKNAKTLDKLFLNKKIYLLQYIVKHTTIHVTLIVAWLEPKPL